MEFTNAELADIYRMAKEDGLKCYTSVSSTPKEKISYFWITDGTQIVYCQAQYSGVTFSSEHKPKNGSGLGTGFGLTNNEPVVINNVDEIKEFFTYRPNWTLRHAVNKWKNWEEFANNERILKVIEI
jgi:hypothetical protein